MTLGGRVFHHKDYFIIDGRHSIGLLDGLVTTSDHCMLAKVYSRKRSQLLTQNPHPFDKFVTHPPPTPDDDPLDQWKNISYAIRTAAKTVLVFEKSER